MVTDFEGLFPGLKGTAYRVTSLRDRAYNCVAWAAGETHRWWWPDPDRIDYWPSSALRAETVEALREVFRSLGYQECEDAELEPGFEKVALFADLNGEPRHVARQQADGGWTSKLGQLEDITHGLRDLEGSEYGSVAQVMKRPRPA